MYINSSIGIVLRKKIRVSAPSVEEVSFETVFKASDKDNRIIDAVLGDFRQGLVSNRLWW